MWIFVIRFRLCTLGGNSLKMMLCPQCTVCPTPGDAGFHRLVSCVLICSCHPVGTVLSSIVSCSWLLCTFPVLVLKPDISPRSPNAGWWRMVAVGCDVFQGSVLLGPFSRQLENCTLYVNILFFRNILKTTSSHGYF